MADIVTPTTWVTGNAITAAQLNANFYSGVVAQSPEEIDGRLDNANLAAATTIGPESIQHRACTHVQSGGSYQLTDYQLGVFEPDKTRMGAYTRIHRCSERFYVHQTDAWVLLIGTWHAGHDGDYPIQLTQVVEFRMQVDGLVVPGTLRAQINPVFPTPCRYARMDKVYCLHYLVRLIKGWHEAGIGVYSQVNLVRIRGRAFYAIELGL